MDEAEGKNPLDTRPEPEEEIKTRRKAAKRALLERLAKQPTMNIGKWTRDELYDRQPAGNEE